MNDDLMYRIGVIEQDVHYTVKIVQELKKFLNENGLSRKTEEPMYYTLEEAVKRKFGSTNNLVTIRTNYALQPCLSTNYKKLNGKRVWTKDLIDEWCQVMDQDIPAYAKKYNVPLTGRIGEKYLKYAKGGNE